MGAWISKLSLHNYRRFTDYEINFNEEKNIIIGDNEAGKSSILAAIDLTLSGNEARVKSIGIDNVFNYDATKSFLDLDKSKRVIANLPHAEVAIYLEDVADVPRFVDLHGKYKDGMQSSYGLRMIIAPDQDLESELKDYLDGADNVFPYDFYKVEFQTFGNIHYTGYRKFIRHLVIDNASDKFDYATNGFVRDAYQLHVPDSNQRARLESNYRTHKNTYENTSLTDINEALEKSEGYRFGIRSSNKSSLETDLTIYRNRISIDSLGLGERVFIKTKFSLNNKKSKHEPNVVLIEEPENHLSHNMMHQLISLIRSSKDAQIFISTHSNTISSRLDLRNCIFIRKETNKPALLKSLDPKTANFFERAPSVSILDFVLANKVVLVEGAAEYILLQQLYRQKYHKDPEDDGVYIASIGGLSFKRYMEIGKILEIKTAVLRDNDKNPQRNCIDNYNAYITDKIKVFFETKPENHTFEKCMYETNKTVCDSIFSSHEDVLHYMLSSKAEAAYILATSNESLVIPNYISEAFEWIRE